jgi:hypothetical protein
MIVSQTIFGKPVNLTLVITANCANMSNILHQIPMFSARSATALRVSQINFCASNRISTQLLSRAKKGARGKAATKIVMKPNCSTEMKIIVIIVCLFSFFVLVDEVTKNENRLRAFLYNNFYLQGKMSKTEMKNNKK